MRCLRIIPIPGDLTPTYSGLSLGTRANTHSTTEGYPLNYRPLKNDQKHPPKRKLDSSFFFVDCNLTVPTPTVSDYVLMHGMMLAMSC